MRALTAAVLLATAAFPARGQEGYAPGAGAPTASARVETAALELTAPDRYRVPTALEPSRRVSLMAAADGVIRGLSAPLGAAVKEGQEVAQLDRAEAAARLEIARAEVKEMQAALEEARPAGKVKAAIAEARLDAARAREKLAQLDLDRCTLRAPFAGRVLAEPVSAGQYVTRGTVVAELADVSGLRALIPVDRSAVGVGGTVNLVVEGRPHPGKVQAILPLDEAFAPLRELAAPLASAWVAVDNAAGALEPGQRVVSPFLPSGPIATVPSRSLREDEEGNGAIVQVIRNEYVRHVPIRVLGPVGDDRTQITGPLRPTDALIVASSLPLAAGTLIRFGAGNGGALEAQAPRPDEGGAVAGITPPPTAAGIAPIGAAGAGARSSSRPAPRPSPTRPAAKTKPAPRTGDTVPF